MAYSGTLAVNGECYGIVVRTGDQTVLGQIAGLASDEHKGASPLSIEVISHSAIFYLISPTYNFLTFALFPLVFPLPSLIDQ